jgi:exopolysaccharide biosynthesis polyprenyl glycosylphosphotransferase
MPRPDALPDAPPVPTTPRPAPRLAPLVTAQPEKDVRRKRPPLLSFLLRWSTARRLARIASLLAVDFAGIFLAIFAALCLKAAVLGGWAPEVSWRQARDYVPFAFLVASLLFARSGLYADRAQRPGLTVIVASLFQTTLVALIFAVVNHEQFQSFYIFYGSLFFSVAFVSFLRFSYEGITGFLLRAAGYRRRAVLVGTGEHIQAVAHALASTGGQPVDVIGFVSLAPLERNGLRSLGSIDDLADILLAHKADEVIIADPAFPEERTLELVDTCHARGVVVRIAPSTMEILIHRAEFVPGQSVPLFELKPPVFDGIDFAVKRCFDLIVSTLLLTFLSPLLLTIALAIKLSSRGPILYRSVRPGIGGVPFECLKFRTMYRDAHARQIELEQLNEASGALFKIRDDPRMTKVGRRLRRFSLDELPQLINVVRGDMSLVGPRPLPERDYARLEDWHKKRYHVLPGITGLWQVSGRADLDFDDLVRLDFLYLERWSVFLDLSILVKTVPAVFARRGAF